MATTLDDITTCVGWDALPTDEQLRQQQQFATQKQLAQSCLADTPEEAGPTPPTAVAPSEPPRVPRGDPTTAPWGVPWVP